ncbi:MAG: hypothetical protein WC575_02355 [Patescibacteria group bacterium]
MLTLLAPYLIGIASALPVIIVWRWPAVIMYAGVYLLLLAAAFLWFMWEPRRLGRALWPWMLLVIFWLSSLFFFLFLEQNYFRLMFIIIIAVVSWWYVYSWQTVEINRGPSLPLSLGLAWIIFFLSTVNNVSWLVFLGFGWWLLFFLYVIITTLVLLSVGWLAGWTLLHHWAYYAVAWVMIIQSYVVFSWWPTSFYLLGWLQATIFLVIFLFTRYDTGVVLTKRSLTHYLLWIGTLSIILIATSRWF